jgi:Uma2 family endonuclease
MAQRKVSSHTIASYRDTFRLLLQFAQKRLRKAPSQLELDNLDASFIGAFEAEYRLGPRTLLRPDLRIAHQAHPVESDDLVGAPVLAIEVVSPSNTAEEMNRKVRHYLGNGAIEVWLVYQDSIRLGVPRGARGRVPRLVTVSVDPRPPDRSQLPQDRSQLRSLN